MLILYNIQENKKEERCDMSYVKKVVKWIVNVFIFILFAILLLIIYGKLQTVFGRKSYPNYFGYTFFEVASGSMEPTLHVNDILFVHITKKNLKENDIITFQGNNEIITHRIKFIDNDELIVKGDANNTADSPIKVDQVIGKVIKVYEKLGVWRKVMTEPKILITVFITLLLFDFALSYDGKKTKDEVKNDNVKTKEDKVEENKVIEPIIISKLEPVNTYIEEENDIQKEMEKEVIIPKIDLVEDKKNIQEETEISEMFEKEQDDYTVRLDLDEIKNYIDKNVK
jgi:signal peptidase